MAALIDGSGISRMLTQSRAQYSSTSSSVSVVRVSGGQQDTHQSVVTSAPAKAGRLASFSPVSRALGQISEGSALMQMVHKSLRDLSLHVENFRPLAGGRGSAWRAELAQHVSELQSMAARASFRGTPLFDGKTHTFQFDVGVSAQHSLDVDISVDMERSLIEHVTIGGADISSGVHLGEAGLAIQVGNETVILYGSYETGQDFVEAINKAGIDGLTASLTSDGRLKLHSYRPIEISGRGANGEHVDISGTLPTTPEWVPEMIPLVRTSVDVDVNVQHVDSLLAAIDMQQGKLDIFQNQLESALNEVAQSFEPAQGVDVQQLTKELASSLKQEPKQSFIAQGDTSDNVLSDTNPA